MAVQPGVSQPVVSQPVHRSGALLDHLARRMRLRAESMLAPLGLRPPRRPASRRSGAGRAGWLTAAGDVVLLPALAGGLPRGRRRFISTRSCRPLAAAGAARAARSAAVIWPCRAVFRAGGPRWP